MRIKAVVVENFRGYRERVTVPLANLTAFIGRNDAGKSTILEALDIFFEGGTIKIDCDDANTNGDRRNVVIGVVFDNLPESLVLDSNAETDLSAEHLLNSTGDLEIHKIFNCSGATPKVTICAVADHPTAASLEGLLQKSNSELKKIVAELGIKDKCNLTVNPSMRAAIKEYVGELNLALTTVPLNEDNGKAVWASIFKYLPLFVLFQSDRPSSDQDPEVQNPMKLAVEQALSTLDADLDAIAEQVRLKAEETAARTLVKLGQTYPGLASALKPRFKKPAWKSLFKMDLEADNGIPLNKRGSGVRRLVLLSFFEAEAEHKRKLTYSAVGHKKPIVYAVEEPETSQHPDHQQKIVRALVEIANAGDQVLLTTHVPALARLLPLESLRFVDQHPDTDQVRIRNGEDGIYDEIAATLGVLPEPILSRGIKVAVLVEGRNDVDALRSFMKITTANRNLPFNEDQIFWTLGGGGSTLMTWVERKYLDKLNIPQVIIQDSDKMAANDPLCPKKSSWLQEMGRLPHVSAFITRKRCMDNYLHPDVVPRLTAGIAVLPSGLDLDHDSMATALSQVLTPLVANNPNNFTPLDHENLPIYATRAEACKKLISAYFMRHMTVGELAARATYTNDNGELCHEVEEWMNAIEAHL